MFFVLSKTLNFLIMPLTLIGICFLIAILARRDSFRKGGIITGIVLFFVFSNEFLANEAMKWWEIRTPAFRDMRNYEVGVVLTGAVIPLLKPDDRVYFHRGVDRVLHTVQLYKLGRIQKILISGGSGRLIDISEREADRFREVMIMTGVPDSVIIVENQTRNTHESAVAVKAIIDSLGYTQDDCLLITSAFHMRRSLACYRKVGLDVDTFTTDFYAHRQPYFLDAFLVPKVEAVVIWHKLFREWAGFIAYRLAGYV